MHMSMRVGTHSMHMSTSVGGYSQYAHEYECRRHSVGQDQQLLVVSDRVTEPGHHHVPAARETSRDASRDASRAMRGVVLNELTR